MHPTVARIFCCLYAAFFAAFTMEALNDDNGLAYSPVYTGLAAVCYACMTFGIVAGAFNWDWPRLRAAWRRLFPLLMVIPAVGIGLDAIMPGDFNLSNATSEWLQQFAIVVVALAPAYIANWKLAYSGVR
jgi:hypothetical protein